MEIRPIRSDEDHRLALAEIEALSPRTFLFALTKSIAVKERQAINDHCLEIENVEVKLMALWIASVAGLAIAYLLGSTPTGYLAGKLLKGIDIREHGSKSTGATNVLRTLGKWPALAGTRHRCAKRCGGHHCCPLVLSLALYSAIQHAVDNV
jgi:hypothetical protein